MSSEQPSLLNTHVERLDVVLADNGGYVLVKVAARLLTSRNRAYLTALLVEDVNEVASPNADGGSSETNDAVTGAQCEELRTSFVIDIREISSLNNVGDASFFSRKCGSDGQA